MTYFWSVLRAPEKANEEEAQKQKQKLKEWQREIETATCLEIAPEINRTSSEAVSQMLLKIREPTSSGPDIINTEDVCFPLSVFIALPIVPSMLDAKFLGFKVAAWCIDRAKEETREIFLYKRSFSVKIKRENGWPWIKTTSSPR
jgi:hypothetical protein